MIRSCFPLIGVIYPSDWWLHLSDWMLHVSDRLIVASLCLVFVSLRLVVSSLCLILCSVSATYLTIQDTAYLKWVELTLADIVVWVVALVAGFLLHYLLPHLRKQTPWHCIAAPLLQSNEQGQFEVGFPWVTVPYTVPTESRNYIGT